MRRGIASLVLALSLVVASIAWSGFVMLHTVLDPGRSERLADQMLDNTVLRGVIVDAVADSIEAAIPAGVEVPRADIEAAATVALEDPRAEALVREGMVRVHQNALEGVEEPVVLDPTAFGAAARDALVGSRPDLDPFLPAAPPVAITLPDTGLSFLGTIRNFLEQAVLTGAVAAVGGVVLALLIARDRPGILRRVSLWAFAASAFWLILGFGVPWLAERLAPSSAAVFAAAVDVFLGAMIPPALFLAAGGVVLVLVSLAWDLGGRRAASRSRISPSFERQASAPPWSPPTPAPVVPDAPYPPPQPRPQPQHHASYRGPADPTLWHAGDRGQEDPWHVASPQHPRHQAPLPGEDPWALTEPEDPPRPRSSGPRPIHSPRWVEGVGYVED